MPYRSILIAVLQAAGLTVTGFLIPVLGQIALLLAPVPLIVLTVSEGRKAGLAATAGAAAVIAVIGGGHAVFVLLFLSLGLMAAGLSEGLMRGWRPENAILIGGLLPLTAVLFVLAPLIFKSGMDPAAVVDEYLRTSIADIQQMYAQLGLTELAALLSSVPERAIHYFVRLLPGLVLATTLMQAAFCFGMARTILIRKHPDTRVAADPTLAAWHAPDLWVWGLIAALVLIVVPNENVRILGLNLVIVYLLVYAAQGSALVEYTLRKAKIAVLWRSLMHTAVLTLPPLLAVVIALGVVDIWADFRKVRTAAPAT